jgi:hypothetical protein
MSINSITLSDEEDQEDARRAADMSGSSGAVLDAVGATDRALCQARGWSRSVVRAPDAAANGISRLAFYAVPVETFTFLFTDIEGRRLCCGGES